MKAKAAPGLKVPKEGKPREYITDAKTLDLPDTAYYRRLVRDGSLVEETDKPAAPSPDAAKKGGKV
ncbi:hypothetical protein DSOUD_0868 [Desulfuromonas soudanensis]|uniref:DUF2635 domain-containing protein n=1 Tax=Desulfuromonas soudanensis TaxID=1603606 RepID=A0A0M4D7V7_9BACT|nr:hypothetical protein [Desulfuromonas soudanensis]ALC15655.1 hypothetical protein DSOUD_0868 [Desulfuromonas soudanensis]